MRLVRVVGVVLCVIALVSFAASSEKDMGIRATYNVTFDVATRVGTAVLPAGDYVIHHVMEGQDHIMVFKARDTKKEVRVKCTLVPLTQKAQMDQVIYQQNSGNERVLQEFVFRGDSAKHVF